MGSYFSCCSLARAAAAPASHFATHLDLNSIYSIGAWLIHALLLTGALIAALDLFAWKLQEQRSNTNNTKYKLLEKKIIFFKQR